MNKEQVNALYNKAKEIGLEDYVVWVTDYEVKGIVRMKSDTSVAILDDATESILVLETNANPTRNTANEKPLYISYVDYDHVTQMSIAITADELREKASSFDFEDEDVKRLIKVVSGTRATGYLRNKDTGELPKIPGRAVDFELGTPYVPYVPEKEEESEGEDTPVEEPTEEPVTEEPSTEEPTIEPEGE